MDVVLPNRLACRGIYFFVPIIGKRTRGDDFTFSIRIRNSFIIANHWKKDKNTRCCLREPPVRNFLLRCCHQKEDAWGQVTFCNVYLGSLSIDLFVEDYPPNNTHLKKHAYGRFFPLEFDLALSRPCN